MPSHRQVPNAGIVKHAGLPVRARLALISMHLASTLSRVTGRGDGSIIGGRIALLIDRNLVPKLARLKTIAIVSGTNGKTTTTRLLTEALGGLDAVATSLTGSNMTAGIVTALGRKSAFERAVLEVDEGYVPRSIGELRPKVVVLLNLSRDQLDRVSEVRMVASRWREALSSTAATIVANADDPLVVFAALDAPDVIWVGMGLVWRHDAYHCPRCDGHIDYRDTDWSCQCGFRRPAVDADVRDDELITATGEHLHLDTSLPGSFNRSNLGVAAIAAQCFGVPARAAIESMSKITNVSGRFATVAIEDKTVRLLLAKNPAGWTGLIDLVHGSHARVVIAINARIADGHDPSWLFDVPFERLQGRDVVACGDRRFDLAVRLRHAQVDHVIGDVSTMRTIEDLREKTVDVIANYTAFQDLRRDLRRPKARSEARRQLDDLILPSAPPAFATRSSGDPLRIVVIYPDLLGTYGDTGNGTVLVNRARWRGIDAECILARSDEPLPLSGDIYVIGGGEDGPQVLAAQLLQRNALSQVVDRKAVVFGVCAGYQILGSHFPGGNGEVHEGLGILDVTTSRTASRRAVGELLGEVVFPGWAGELGILTGFENHASHTEIGDRARPLMRVLRGVGNGSSGLDGAVQGRVIGTYLHGPALARNPALADLLLRTATGASLQPLDDEEEGRLRAERLETLGIARERKPKRQEKSIPD